MPSKAYHDAVAEGARHHASSKTYSGSLLRPHKPFLSDMVKRLKVKSAMDYGAGKGTQYKWVDPADGKTLEQAWGFEVAKFDPCYPPYADEPEGPFDLVICTHTLALIPLADHSWVLDRIYGAAKKGVFIAEKIGERKKTEVADPRSRAIGWTSEQWLNWLAPFAAAHVDKETILSLRVRDRRGAIMTRYKWDKDGWLAVASSDESMVGSRFGGLR